MRLTNPSNDELNAAFAEAVAGWKCEMIYGAWSGDVSVAAPVWTSPNGTVSTAYFIPKFTQSADAVLPWLEKTFCAFSYHTDRPDRRLQFCADKKRDGQLIASSGTFPRAAVIALLIAHGVEVEFTQ